MWIAFYYAIISEMSAIYFHMQDSSCITIFYFTSQLQSQPFPIKQTRLEWLAGKITPVYASTLPTPVRVQQELAKAQGGSVWLSMAQAHLY
jgi:hypothetical protein